MPLNNLLEQFFLKFLQKVAEISASKVESPVSSIPTINEKILRQKVKTYFVDMLLASLQFTLINGFLVNTLFEV
jgi:hypothetical protein